MTKVGLCIVAFLCFICLAMAQEGEGSAPNNELMVQTMNASGHTT
jgi:hypothetical protein